MYCDISILILWRLINYNSKTFNYGIIFQLFVALLSLFLGSLMLWYSNTFLWVVLGIWFCDGWLIIFTICYFKTFIGGILFQLSFGLIIFVQVWQYDLFHFCLCDMQFLWLPFYLSIWISHSSFVSESLQKVETIRFYL